MENDGDLSTPRGGPDTLGRCYRDLARRVRSADPEDRPLRYWPTDGWHFYHWIAMRMAAAGLVRADVGPDEVAIYELTPGGQELLDRT
jgi:hypothetical protein